MEAYGNLTDFGFGEKRLYGRVNRLFIPMEGTFKNYGSKKFSDKQATSQSLSAIDFVVDAFNGLAQQFRKCALTRKIDSQDPFLTNLIIYRAFESPQTVYQRHYNSYMTAIDQAFRNQNIKVENFKQFIDELMGVLDDTSRTFAFTYPGFVKSRFCPISVSGLALEIANLDPNNDDEKIKQFVNSNNWEFYLNACRSYGFMVDRNIPWRIVADIGSSAMIEYATKYGTTSTSGVLTDYYKPAWESYYIGFKERLLILYNKVRPQHIWKTRECNGATIPFATAPITYTSEYLNLGFSESFFLETYCKMRFLEEESKFTENEMRLIIDDVLEMYMSRSIERALMQFERILNKPFDYRGSLSYINKRKKVLDALE